MGSLHITQELGGEAISELIQSNLQCYQESWFQWLE